MLEQVRTKLQHLTPEQAQLLGDNSIREAAVLMALTNARDPEVVFIRRAEHMTSHSGQVAFPGGMWEPQDNNLIHTALRESEEEISLPPSCVEVVAALEPKTTRFSVRVTPFVGFIPQGLSFIPELAEIESIFQVPLSYLLEPDNYNRTVISSVVGQYEAPCIYYEDYCIWGFTFAILTDVLKDVFGLDMGISLEIKEF